MIFGARSFLSASILILPAFLSGCAPSAPDSEAAAVIESEGEALPETYELLEPAESNEVAETAAEPKAPLLPGWITERSSSGLDGDVFYARKILPFPDRRTEIHVTVVCKQASRETALWIDSYVGDPSNPSFESEFKRDFVRSRSSLDVMTGKPGSLLAVGVGRVKFHDVSVRDLKQHFRISDARSNRLEFMGVSLVDFELLRVPDGVQIDTMQPGAVNSGRVFKELLPAVLEVNNGAGAFEIMVDRSAEIDAVLAPCGGSEPALPGI